MGRAVDSLAASSIAGTFGTLSPMAERGVVVGGSKLRDTRTGEDVFTIDLYDLDRSAFGEIVVDFLAHGMTTLPGKPHIAALFEKRGPSACIVDLARRKLLQPLVAGTGRLFYGHGAYSADGLLLYSVEIKTDTHEGVLTARDAKTLEPKHEIPTFGDNPHDCVLLADGKTLAITNGGGALGTRRDPSVTFVDLPTMKLVEKHTFSDPKVNAGHIAIAQNGDFAVVSAPRDGLDPATSRGALHLRTGRQKIERVKKPESVTSRMLSESLSVAIHEPTRVVAATNPYSDFVSFWNLDTKKHLRSYDWVSTRGVAVTLDERYFVLSQGKEGSLLFVDPHTLEIVEGGLKDSRRFSGSHIHMWRATAA